MEKATQSDRGKKLCAMLIQARRRARLTQVEVAYQLGKAQSFVSYYEKGLRRLDLIEFLDVTEVLKADPVRIMRALADDRGTPPDLAA